MKQFKTMEYSALLLILFCLTSTNGFLEANRNTVTERNLNRNFFGSTSFNFYAASTKRERNNSDLDRIDSWRSLDLDPEIKVYRESRHRDTQRRDASTRTRSASGEEERRFRQMSERRNIRAREIRNSLDLDNRRSIEEPRNIRYNENSKTRQEFQPRVIERESRIKETRNNERRQTERHERDRQTEIRNRNVREFERTRQSDRESRLLERRNSNFRVSRNKDRDQESRTQSPIRQILLQEREFQSERSYRLDNNDRRSQDRRYRQIDNTRNEDRQLHERESRRLSQIRDQEDRRLLNLQARSENRNFERASKQRTMDREDSRSLQTRSETPQNRKSEIVRKLSQRFKEDREEFRLENARNVVFGSESMDRENRRSVRSLDVRSENRNSERANTMDREDRRSVRNLEARSENRNSGRVTRQRTMDREDRRSVRNLETRSENRNSERASRQRTIDREARRSVRNLEAQTENRNSERASIQRTMDREERRLLRYLEAPSENRNSKRASRQRTMDRKDRRSVRNLEARTENRNSERASEQRTMDREERRLVRNLEARSENKNSERASRQRTMDREDRRSVRNLEALSENIGTSRIRDSQFFRKLSDRDRLENRRNSNSEEDSRRISQRTMDREDRRSINNLQARSEIPQNREFQMVRELSQLIRDREDTRSLQIRSENARGSVLGSEPRRISERTMDRVERRSVRNVETRSENVRASSQIREKTSRMDREERRSFRNSQTPSAKIRTPQGFRKLETRLENVRNSRDHEDRRLVRNLQIRSEKVDSYENRDSQISRKLSDRVIGMDKERRHLSRNARQGNDREIQPVEQDTRSGLLSSKQDSRLKTEGEDRRLSDTTRRIFLSSEDKNRFARQSPSAERRMATSFTEVSYLPFKTNGVMNALQVVLLGFLIAQIVADSSKAKKNWFSNLTNFVTVTKEKVL